MVKAPVCHRCSPCVRGSTPGRGGISCGLSFLFVLSLASRVFSPGPPVFPLSIKTNFDLAVLRGLK